MIQTVEAMVDAGGQVRLLGDIGVDGPRRTFRKPSIIQRRFGYSSGNCEMTSIAVKIAIQNSVMSITVPLDSAPMVMPHETTTARQEPP